MKLSNSEVLFLSQVLFYLKNFSSQFHWECDETLSGVLKKCEQHLVKNAIDISKPTVPGCAWHEESSCEAFEEVDEEDSQPDETLQIKFFLDLQPVRISYNGDKRKMAFEKGTSAGVLDITLDDGDEILCDVTEIERTGASLTVNCAEGCIDFDVQKFPKDWTTLLSTGLVYKVIA
jgi:hypothetical protein